MNKKVFYCYLIFLIFSISSLAIVLKINNNLSFNHILNLNADSDLEKYEGEVEHLFTHCLLAYPKLALNTTNPLSEHCDRDCLTPTEFKNMLNILYGNNYILIDINSVFEVVNGVAKKKPLFLPKGKKPLILSFDDVNYDSKKKNSGMVDKLILDLNNNIASYSQSLGLVSYDNEFLPILETFIKKHPNFSYKGARGLICLTGYDGILGYRTQKGSVNREQEIKKVTPLVKQLKKLGWKFACHSYGHYHMQSMSEYNLLKDIINWQTEVEPIIGKTNIYTYPYGDWEISNLKNEISNKHNILLKAGFKLFLGVGAKNYFSYIPIGTKETHTLFMDRKPIDGRTLRAFNKYYKHLFNTKYIYDHTNRTVSFNNNWAIAKNF